MRGGSHSGPGFGTNDGGAVIDLSPMKGIRVDPHTQTVRNIEQVLSRVRRRGATGPSFRTFPNEPAAGRQFFGSHLEAPSAQPKGGGGL